MSDRWRAACPCCRAELGDLPLDGPPLSCAGCTTDFPCVGGIWRFLPADQAATFERFLADYRTVRRAEGRGSDDPADYRRLPVTRPDDPLAWQWRVRARTWDFLAHHQLSARHGPVKVADLGAGVGWLANRAAGLGHRPIAVDLDDDRRDGLGAARHFERAFPRLQATFDRLPLASTQADVVVYNASFHYSTDPVATLAEGLRLLRPGGLALIVDSPIYRHDASGRRMAEDRHADFEARFGTRSDTLASIEYLTDDLLDHLATALELHWRRGRPWYGWRWAARPLVARARRRREPSRFHVLEARRAGEADGDTALGPPRRRARRDRAPHPGSGRIP